jgi:hypothetical protein
LGALQARILKDQPLFHVLIASPCGKQRRTGMKTSLNDAALVKDHTPVLVLYPEIPEGSLREENPDYPQEAPLLYDYHPRDVRIVLENSGFHHRFRPWQDRTCNWKKMLDRMERKHYRKNLDLLPGVPPDDRKAFWKAYAAIPKDNEYYQRACYARVVRGAGINSGRVLAQYWYAYFYNDFWNTHEMDWEVVMVVFKLAGDGAVPTICAYSAHFGGYWLPWTEVEKANAEVKPETGGTHPVVFVANGSHANYFYGPAQYRTAPELVSLAAMYLKKKKRGLIDYTTSFEAGETRLVEARLIPEGRPGQWSGDWRWLNQEGLWGSPGDWDLEFGDSAPHGPPQGGDRWDQPFRWIDTNCTRALPRSECFIPTRLEPPGP